MEHAIATVDNNAPSLLVSARHEDVQCITHLHATPEIVLVTEGTLHMTIGTKEYDIGEGYGVFIEPFQPHAFRSIEKNRCHVLMFSREVVGTLVAFLKNRSVSNPLFRVSPPALALSQALLPHNMNRPDHICSQAVLAPLCYDIRQGCELSEKTAENHSLHGILEYISDHFSEEITLERVASATGVSKVTVSRLFARMGTGFCYFLQYCRCTHAARLLHTEDMTVSQVAYESGFGSIRSFNRAFFKIHKMTPSQYKEEK